MNLMDRDTLLSFMRKNNLEGNILRHKKTGRRYVYLDKAVDAGHKGRVVWILRAIPSWRLLVIDEEPDGKSDFEIDSSDEALEEVLNGMNDKGGI